MSAKEMFGFQCLSVAKTKKRMHIKFETYFAADLYWNF